jgi:hypothetical protein
MADTIRESFWSALASRSTRVSSAILPLHLKARRCARSSLATPSRRWLASSSRRSARSRLSSNSFTINRSAFYRASRRFGHSNSLSANWAGRSKSRFPPFCDIPGPGKCSPNFASSKWTVDFPASVRKPRCSAQLMNSLILFLCSSRYWSRDWIARVACGLQAQIFVMGRFRRSRGGACPDGVVGHCGYSGCISEAILLPCGEYEPDKSLRSRRFRYR